MRYGIDIGGTKIETVVFDEALNQVERWRVATPVENYQDFLDCVVQQVLKADTISMAESSVGIGVPGLVDQDGRSLSVNVPCMTGQNVQQDLLARLNRPIFVENDCRCFALSEAITGAGKQYQRVFGAVLGTGAAGGLCVNGKLENGKNRMLGEFGHIPIPAFLAEKYRLSSFEGRAGLVGCMEQYVSGPGLSYLYQYFVEETITAQTVVSRLRQGEKAARNVFSIYSDLVAYTFSSIILHHDPDIIVLGGGLSNIPEIYSTVPNLIQNYLFSTVTLPPIKPAEFGDSSGVRGAALLVR